MRALLATLAIMAITTPAFANEMNNDPEGSIQKSTSSAVQPSANEDTPASRLEPAAGTETTKEYKETNTTETKRPAHAKKAHSTTVRTENHKKRTGDVQTEAEPTAKTSRAVE